MSTLPSFLKAADVMKNNALGVRFTCFMAKKGGQKAPISSGRKIREPFGPDDRRCQMDSQRDPLYESSLFAYGTDDAVVSSCTYQ